jgi:hypothetical protein
MAPFSLAINFPKCFFFDLFFEPLGFFLDHRRNPVPGHISIGATAIQLKDFLQLF